MHVKAASTKLVLYSLKELKEEVSMRKRNLIALFAAGSVALRGWSGSYNQPAAAAASAMDRLGLPMRAQPLT
jgi:hypothetical protein